MDLFKGIKNRFVFFAVFAAAVFFGLALTHSTQAAANSTPIGSFETLSCEVAVGWTCDPDDYTAALKVHFYANGKAGQGGTFVGATTANITRGVDVANLCGGVALHGFSFNIPSGLKDSQSHDIYAYAINVPAGKNPLISGSPKSLNCTLPTPTPTPSPTPSPIPTETPTPSPTPTPEPSPTPSPTPSLTPTPTPTPTPPMFSRDYANSYDDSWQDAWVANARSILLGGVNKTSGFVLEIGDSMTRSGAYAAWPRLGQGKTLEDTQILDWTNATVWSSSASATIKNGFYLATFNITVPKRSFTASGGISTTMILSGTGNGGPDMPAIFDPALAQQTLSDPYYSGNLQIDTVISAFSDAQFAVVMLGTNGSQNPSNIANLTTIIRKLEAAHIVPILSTIPPNGTSDAANQLVDSLNASIVNLARTENLPLIDLHQEILNRRPGTSWYGTLINTTDGVHLSTGSAGFTTSSDPYTPGGDPLTHVSGDTLLNVGYLLRSWLTVQKIKEVKASVVDIVPTPTPIPTPEPTPTP